MELERVFCRYCRRVLGQGEEMYHQECSDLVEGYQVDTEENRESRYSVQIEIIEQAGYVCNSRGNQWMEYTNTVVITGSREQRAFIDLIYRDLKEKFQLERIHLPFPLMSDANGQEFVVVNNWNIIFSGWAVGYPGSMFRRGELYSGELWLENW